MPTPGWQYSSLKERLVAELIEDDEVEALQAFGQLAGSVRNLLLLECIDQIDGGEEPDLITVMLDRLHKEFKRIAMRASKTDKSFAAMIYLTAAVINSR